MNKAKECASSKTTKAQQKCVQKYVKNNYDKILLTVPKGKRDVIKEHAKQENMSVNSYISKAIDEKMGI